MDKLIDWSLTDDDENSVRARVAYDILNATKIYKEFKPCLKRYVYRGIASKILKVQPQEWETALFLPTQQFQKAKARDVWQESMAEIKNTGRPSGMANTVPTIGQVW